MKRKLLLFCALYGLSCYAQVNLDSGLVAWYPQSGNCNDYSGNGNHSTVTNCTPSTNRFGTSNSAYQLNGVGSQWEAPHSASFATIDNNDAVSISAWINISALTQNWFSVMNKYNTLNDMGYTLQYNGGGTSLDFACDNGWFGTSYNFQLNTWYHVVLTYSQSAGQGKFYINGNLHQTLFYNFALPTTNGPMYVGFNPLGGDEYSTGRIDDLRLYNRVITPSEVTALYQSYAPSVTAASVCQFAAGTLNAQGDSIYWYSDAGLTNLVGTGSSYSPSSAVSGSQSFYAVNVVDDGAGAAVPVSFTVWPLYNVADTVSICQGDSVLIGAQYQNSTGSYPVTLQTIHSCDSIITTWLEVRPVTSFTISQTSCDSFVLNSQTYYATGTFTQHFTNSTGCDSTVVLNLTINQQTDSSLSIATCDSVIINNQLYTGSGIYYQTLPNAAGCDSVLTLNIQISHSSDTLLSLSACDTVSVNSQDYTSTGVYQQTITNAAGCDSVLTLNVQISYSSDTLLMLSACDTVSVNSQDYTSTGIYQQIITNTAGCDSVITLDVVIHGFPSVVFSLNADTVCLDDADLTLSGSPAGGIWTGNGVNGNLFDPSVGTGVQNITYTFTDSLGCVAGATDAIYVDVCAAIPAHVSTLNSQVSIFPNPNNGTFTVQTGEGMNAQYIRLYDGSGRLAAEWNLSENHSSSISLATTTKEVGVYMLEVLMQDGSLYHSRTVITK